MFARRPITRPRLFHAPRDIADYLTGPAGLRIGAPVVLSAQVEIGEVQQPHGFILSAASWGVNEAGVRGAAMTRTGLRLPCDYGSSPASSPGLLRM